MAGIKDYRLTRDLCYHCFLDKEHCICNGIKPILSPINVIILQHIRERHKAIGTEKIVRLSIPGTRTYSGIKFQNQLELTKTLTDKNQQGYLLYPCKEAQLAEDVVLDFNQQNFLVVLDGTWPHANRIYKENPLLHQLKPVAINTNYISNYRIRTQPNSLCLSTVEATVLCLESLEKKPGKYASLLKNFELMIDRQCEYIPTDVLINRKKFKKLKVNI